MYPQSASGMGSPRGGLGKTLLIIVLIIMLIASLIFGGWAYKKMGDYKDMSNAKVAAAAALQVKSQAQRLQDNFDAQNVETFTSSPTYGSISFNYPKTWSVYNDNSDSNEPINAYFFPGVVPSVNGTSAFALRVELVNTDYSQIQQQFSGSVSQGTLTSRGYVPPKMKGVANVVAGTYMTGQVNQNSQDQNGAMVVIKVRDTTLEIYTESNQYLNDFNNIVLSSLKFSP